MNDPASAAYRRAWLSLVAFIPAIVVAFVVGEGLGGLLGHEVATDEVPPLRVVVVAGIPALLIVCLPALMAWSYGRRAARLGRPSAMTPAIVAGVIAGAFVAQNVLSYALGRVVG